MTSTKTTMHITDIRTIAVPVTDQDQALQFYRDGLGLETASTCRTATTSAGWRSCQAVP